MSVIEELIRRDDAGTLSFGNYQLDAKTKKSDFHYEGASYKIKTFKEITKLERNGMFVYESVPGTAVIGFKSAEEEVSFQVEGPNDAQITLELEAGTEYNIIIDGMEAGVMKTNLGGKLNISVEMEGNGPVSVKISKK